MTEQIRLYSQDYMEVLLTTDDRAAAEQYLRDSGADWLPIVIDYGHTWKQRWSGLLELRDNGNPEIAGGTEFLNYIIQTPNPDIK